MIIGLNENVTYRGVVFHIQTEDRGTSRPMVVSTLFYKGMIILEERKDYSSLVGSGNEKEKIMALKNELHQRVKENLLSGNYDNRIKEYFKSLKKEKKEKPSAPSDNKELLSLLQAVILPSLSEDLGIKLSTTELDTIKKEIATIKGSTRKERFLSLCSIIYKTVSNRCSREDFKSIAKTWLKGEKQKVEDIYKYKGDFRSLLERIVFKDLESAIGSSLTRALIDKVMEELHPMFFKKPEAFEIIVKRIVNSGIVQKKTSPEWQKTKETAWKELYKNLKLTGQLSG